jgi:hypothetical protein
MADLVPVQAARGQLQQGGQGFGVVTLAGVGGQGLRTRCQQAVAPVLQHRQRQGVLARPGNCCQIQ